jgi:predicted transposase/invertase (TIGR01784 family)
MRRDTIFYQLFQQSPTLLFDLIPQPPENADEYTFDAIEVKETAFRLDGVFRPPNPAGIVYFCEVQFQLDELLYERMDSETRIYIYRNRERFFNWRSVVIYPTRSVEQSRRETVQDLLDSGRITRVYLDELGDISNLPTGLGLMVLTTLEGDEAKNQARRLVDRSRSIVSIESPENQAIISLVSTIVLYKFNSLTREEVDIMLGITLQETRVYRDAVAEGEIIGEARVIVRQLNRRLGSVPSDVVTQIQQLTIPQLDELGDALLDFTTLADLADWLSQN